MVSVCLCVDYLVCVLVTYVLTHSILLYGRNPVLKKALAPTEEEVERNKRSRSAKLRVAERLSLYPEYSLSVPSQVKDAVDASSGVTPQDVASTGSLGRVRGRLMGAKQLAKLAKQQALDESEGVDTVTEGR